MTTKKKKKKTRTPEQIRRDAAAAAMDFFNSLHAAREDCLCIETKTTSGEVVRPTVLLVTGTPFWNHQIGDSTPPAWAPKNVNAVFCIAAYDEPVNFDPVELELEVTAKAETSSRPNPCESVRAPFELNGIKLAGSSIMLVEPELHLSVHFHKNINWDGTFLVRCPLDSFLNSFAPDPLIVCEDGKFKVSEGARGPDDLAKAIGMGYKLEWILSPLGNNEKRWRSLVGLNAASEANGISTFNGRQPQFARHSKADA